MPGLGQAPCFSELFVPVSCNLLQLEWQVAPKGGRKQPRVWTSMPFPFLGPSLPMPGLHQCPAPPGHVGIVLGGPSASGLAQSPRLAWKPAPVLATPPPAPSLALAPCPCHSEPRKPGPFLFGRDSQSLCPCPAGSSQRPQHRDPAQGSRGGMCACSGLHAGPGPPPHR